MTFDINHIKMKKYLFLMLFNTICFSVFAQKTGINERDPESMLSVKGELSVGKDSSFTRELAPLGGAIIQGTVGIGTNAPDSSAILELNATDKGILVPRVSTTQRNSISNPANGLLLYDTNESKFYYYADTLWKPIEGNSNTGQLFPSGALMFGAGSGTTSDSSNLFWNNTSKRLGIRTISPTASLQVNGEGSDSTAFAMKIHNSSGSNNALLVRNDGLIRIGSNNFNNVNTKFRVDNGNFEFYNDINDFRYFFTGNTSSGTSSVNSLQCGAGSLTSANSTNFSIFSYPNENSNTHLRGGVALVNSAINGSSNTHIRKTVFFIHNNNDSSGFEFNFSSTYVIQSSSRKLFLTGLRGNLILGTNLAQAGTSATKTFVIENGTAPTGNLVDAVQLFSRDRIAGQAGLGIRSENGTQHIFSDRVGIGTITPNASLTVVGAGTTDTTFSLQVHNSTGTNNSLAITDAGVIRLGNVNYTPNVSSPNVYIGNSISTGNAGTMASIKFGQPGGGGNYPQIFASRSGSSGTATSISFLVHNSSNAPGTFAVGVASGQPFDQSISIIPSYEGVSLITNTRNDATGVSTIFRIRSVSLDSTKTLNLTTTNGTSGGFVDRLIIGNGSTVVKSNFINTTLGISDSGDQNVNQSAVLDVQSTTRGFLPPRMTTTQRDAITSPAEGLVIFNSTTKKHQGFDGTQWNDFY